MKLDWLSLLGALSCGIAWGIFVYINLKMNETRKRLDRIHERIMEMKKMEERFFDDGK